MRPHPRAGRQARGAALPALRRDTVCALATPPGPGSIAVIRISGPQTFTILDRVFIGPRPSRQPSHTVQLGWLVDPKADSRIDQVMLTVFRSPRSYTGENMAEISCHGGTIIADQILNLLERQGCRRAEPGEFARRAVLAGKLTLTQAEATLDLINARSPAALRSALERYQGGLSRLVQGICEELRDLCAQAEHYLAFDDSDSTRPPSLASGTRRLIRQLERIISRAEDSLHSSEAANVVIVGRPNVGKSSLFNRLLEDARALVAPVPGTTRDRIEATMVIGNISVTLTDTAGLFGRSARPDKINLLTRNQTMAAINHADLVLAVFDGSEPVRRADIEVQNAVASRPVLYVVNKKDKAGWREPGFLNGHARIAVSALTGAGIGRLRAYLSRRFQFRGAPALACARHLELFREARIALERSLSAPDADASAVELREALADLEQIDAPGSDTQVLDRVFARFCVGK